MATAPSLRGALDACQKRLEYRFQNTELLVAALTHSSSAISRKDSYERMEFLGDSVLGLVICQVLYERLPDAMEGDLTKIKSAVVSRRVCARVTDRLGLAEYVLTGQGVETGEQMPRSLAAAVFEALVAAVYLDGGLDPARDFILRAMDEDIQAATDSGHQFNYKSQLQQHAQRELHGTPEYDLLDEKGPDHSKCFEVAVTIAGRQFPSAWGPSKKEAEQKAARAALVALGLMDDGPDPHFDAI